MSSYNVKELAGFIWSVADLLRGDYKQADYGKVILPLTVLRRLDCVLENTKQNVLDWLAKHPTNDHELVLNAQSKYPFHNRSKYNFKSLVADSVNLAANLRDYINGFSADAREIVEHFEFDKQIHRLESAGLLYKVVKKFEEIDLHTDRISNIAMGYVFEELIRKFAEISNETAGEHFTPREVIHLMVDVLFLHDGESFRPDGVIKTLYDCACGTGGMLSAGEERVRQLNPQARLEVFGQELNPESYAICKSDMLIKGHRATNIRRGNSFSEDHFSNQKFDYMLSNPPFGVEWKKVEQFIKNEHDKQGFAGRFGAGLPRISDGSLLFLQHLVSKMKQPNPEAGNGGSRIAIVFNGSPLFSGSAGSGESDIRRWIIENDMLEGIIAMPEQLFYNTGISTYIWIVTNRKPAERKGRVQLFNAGSFYQKMNRSLGSKRHEITKEQREEIVRMYGEFRENKYSKIFDNEFFGYSRITVERPLYDENGKPVADKKGKPKADADLRDAESVPLSEDIESYFRREVLPHVPDAWIDHSKTKIGYEINFTKYFYQYKPLRSLADIRADILRLEHETEGLIKEVIEA